MSNIIPFSFENHEVRVLDKTGEPWWVLADVCKVLEINNSRQATTRLDDDEKGVTINDTLGGPQEMTIINESGLWSLVLTSRKPEARRFKKWITSEVIPTIRRTGSWGRPVTPMPSRLTARQVREAVGMLRSFTYVNRITGMEKNQALLAANRRVQENTGINLLQQTGATHLLANDTDHR